MDVFAKLPPELRLMIFEQFSNFRDAQNLAQAAESMFQLFQARKSNIFRLYINTPCDNNMIQDAIAIISFPRFNGETSFRQHFDEVEKHLKRWGKKQLPDPFDPASKDSKIIHNLENLFRWVWLYVDDYLSKATSDFLPRAYCRLPIWSSFGDSLTQVELRREARYIRRDELTKRQKYQIIKAFLRYELLCRIYGPHGHDKKFLRRINNVGLPKDYDIYDIIDEYGEDYKPNCLPDRRKSPFHIWDWTILNRYEGSGTTSSSDVQLLPCIREYLGTLYVAYITDYLTQSAPIASVTTGGINPALQHASSKWDSPLPGDSEIYNDLLLYIGHAHEAAVSLAASSGLDLATNILISGMTENDFRTLIDHLKSHSPRYNSTNINRSIRGRDAPAVIRDQFHANNFIRLYRQRAWPLLKESRIGPGLPTEDEYEKLCGPGPLGGRIKWGLENDNSTGEAIIHGDGVWTGPVADELREPFWKQRSV